MRFLVPAGAIAIVVAAPVYAGMPSPLPSGDELDRVFRLNESADQRVQAISFFVVGLLMCAAAVRWLWNYVARDFAGWPRLTYGKALAGVVLWGLLFVLVLTMISGARELMTPGAWKKQGFTYKLADAPDQTSDPSPVTVRRQQLEQLRQALWHFAATHHGHFPSEGERTAIPADLWIVPETGGLRYQYRPGQVADQVAAPLVIAPELEPGRRLVLRTDGTIADLPASEIDLTSKSEGGP
jgi:hypothetical protein